tara:strand:+ start:6283 stop:6459 length:177 start_codon:yes stop_codon:yes gene_type:complete
MAPTGEAGVEAASRLRPDLVIMDLMLPGISGAEAARELLNTGSRGSKCFRTASDHMCR